MHPDTENEQMMLDKQFDFAYNIHNLEYIRN